MASTMLLRQEDSTAVPQLRIYTGTHRIDRFLGGFFSAHLYHATGSVSLVQTICTMLMVQTVQQFNGDILFLDGSNTIDPYAIAQYARAQQSDADHVLTHIKVARAFTAYQLDTLIHHIPRYVEEFTPLLVIVNGITDLLHDTDVGQQEGETLLRRWLTHIKQQADRHSHVALVTSRAHSPFTQLCQRYADHALSCEHRGTACVIKVDGQGQRLQYQPVPVSQATIDDFMEDVPWAEP